jgi:hypothetical protein
MEKPIENKLQFASQKKFVEELKVEWKLMWSERFDDKPKAEGVSVANYDSLGVERGTIIHATRDFKALNFREILEQHKINQPDRFIEPHPNVGGWNKFIKTKITNAPNKNIRIALNANAKKSVAQQPKKNGRGWLHKE